ncbi:MAG TPA: histidine phosphatase family protein [Stellaceae bacterium]|nr:histidine phosphatase family protein [Stellaceae bacterium]
MPRYPEHLAAEKDDRMTKIILVRHGHVEGISPERYRGRVDLTLTAEGRRQAAVTADRIHATWRPAAVFASPLSRCRATAEAIATPLGLSPRPLDGLIDIDYGQWQGLTPDEVRARWPGLLETWYRAPDWAAIPGGETLQDVLVRALSALRDVVDRHPSDTVVLVAHDSVNRVILLHALGLPLSRYWRLGQHPCAINEIDLLGDGSVVLSMNETGHLKQAASP